MYNLNSNSLDRYKMKRYTQRELNDKEIQLEQLRNLKTIKNIMVFFTVLIGSAAFVAILGLLFSIA